MLKSGFSLVKVMKSEYVRPFKYLLSSLFLYIVEFFLVIFLFALILNQYPKGQNL